MNQHDVIIILYLQAAARVPILMSWTLKLPVIKDWMELLSFFEKILIFLQQQWQMKIKLLFVSYTFRLAVLVIGKTYMSI